MENGEIGSTEKGRRTNSVDELFGSGKVMPRSQTPKQGKTKRTLSIADSSAKVFSILDANQGYWQIHLDPVSQRLTTFNTPFG